MPETAQTPAAPEAPDSAGWYRNRAAVPLTVLYPTAAQLDPGKPTWLAADPQHPDIEPCDAPDTAAAETKD